MNYLSFSKEQAEIGIRLWMGRKKADACGDGLVVVRKIWDWGSWQSKQGIMGYVVTGWGEARKNYTVICSLHY